MNQSHIVDKKQPNGSRVGGAQLKPRQGTIEPAKKDMTVTTGAFAVGDISGGAFNPAVAVGISILGLSSWGNVWIYLLANFGAAVVAAVVFNLINPPTQTTPIATDEPPYETPQ